MSRRLGARPATTAALLVPALATAFALSACGAGTDANTSLARSTTNAAAGATGSVTLRNVYVAGPVTAGGTAQIISAFFNGGTEADALTGVSSPAAAGGRVPTPDALNPGGASIYIANGSAPALTNVKSALLVGSSIPVTFTFAKAPSLTLQVPVQMPEPGASAAPTAVVPTALATISSGASSPPAVSIGATATP